MKKITAFNWMFYYICIVITLVVVGKSFAIKSTILNSGVEQRSFEEGKNPHNNNIAKGFIQYFAPEEAATEDMPADSLDFQVKVVKPHKFLLSFQKKREEAFYIKIYDVIGNLLYHEVVSNRGKFRKEYDLSKYTTDLYIIEVSSGKTAKSKKLFLG